jgi:hypothetical protein
MTNVELVNFGDLKSLESIWKSRLEILNEEYLKLPIKTIIICYRFMPEHLALEKIKSRKLVEGRTIEKSKKQINFNIVNLPLSMNILN